MNAPHLPKKPRKWLTWIAITLAIGGGCLFIYGPVSLLLSIFTPPPITDHDHLGGLEETSVTLSDLRFEGSVISSRDNSLTLYTAKEETTFYKSNWRIYALAGPNSLGHLVVFEIEQTANQYRFVLIDFNKGTAKQVHSGAGDVIWDDVVGEMRIHPKQDSIFFFRGHGSRQYPGAYVNTGSLMKLDLSTGTESEITRDVKEGDFAISADGERLFFARTSNLPEPEITELSLATGLSKSLGSGWYCNLSFDSNSVEIRDGSRKPVRVYDIKSGESKPSQGQDLYFYPHYRISQTLYVGESLPLNRDSVKYFPATGSISGPHMMMRLGVFEPTAKRAAILRADLDRYDSIAYAPQQYTAKGLSLKL